MQDVMIDLETMGTGPDSAIVSIGAVEFDRAAQQLGETFYVAIDLKSAQQTGGVIDADTVLWWLKQSSQAREALCGTSVQMASALASFSGWLRGRCELRDVRIWGNGSDFDNVILANAYRRLAVPVPWKFWNNRCYRTWKNEHPEAVLRRSGTHHNALDDAISQAEHMLQVEHIEARAA